MVKWRLHTKILQVGRVSIEGREDGSFIVFDDPRDDGSIVLRVTKERAEEISLMPRSSQSRMNLFLERYEIYTGKEAGERPQLRIITCQFCNQAMTVIDTDFILHRIPWCSNWRKIQMENR